MRRLNKLRKTLKTGELQVVNTKKGKHPFKVKGIILGTSRQHTYPLKVHGKNPEISKSYLNEIKRDHCNFKLGSNTSSIPVQLSKSKEINPWI